MVSGKRIVQMARKWQKMAARMAALLGRRRIINSRKGLDGEQDDAECNTSSSFPSRGHLFMYTMDRKRFMVPIGYLSSSIFRELFKIAEEEFGLPTDGPIVLPCDAASMEYIISLLQCRISREVESAVLTFIRANTPCMATLPPQRHNQFQQGLVYAY